MPFILYRMDTGEVVYKAPTPYGDLPEGVGEEEVGPDVLPGMIRAADGTYGDPEPAPQPAKSVITYKADLYRRCSEAEAEAIEMALMAASVRDRRLFETAQYLNSTDPDFDGLRQAMAAMFGQERADELLAASA